MKKSAITLTILSSLASIGFGVWTLYLSSIGNLFFIPICAYYFLEGIFLVIPCFTKDEYKGMKIISIFQVAGVILMMCYLLFMILWSNDGKMIFTTTYFVLGGAILIKTITSIVSHILLSKEYLPLLHSTRNSDLISLNYLAVILELVICTYFDNPTRILALFIVEVGTNAILTGLVAFLALSLIIMAYKKEEQTTIGKFKTVGSWFRDNEVGLFFGVMFSTYLAIVALINMRNSFFYIFIAVFYLVFVFIRLLNWNWHRKIVKNNPDQPERVNHYSSKIMIFDALVFFLVGSGFATGAILMVLEKLKTETNIYYFLIILLPFTLMKVITTITSFKNGKKANDVYIEIKNYLSLISLGVSLLGVIAIACYSLPIGAKAAIVITSTVAGIVLLQFLVLVMVVKGIRGLFVHKRRRVKKA